MVKNALVCLKGKSADHLESVGGALCRFINEAFLHRTRFSTPFADRISHVGSSRLYSIIRVSFTTRDFVMSFTSAIKRATSTGFSLSNSYTSEDALGISMSSKAVLSDLRVRVLIPPLEKLSKIMSVIFSTPFTKAFAVLADNSIFMFMPP